MLWVLRGQGFPWAGTCLLLQQCCPSWATLGVFLLYPKCLLGCTRNLESFSYGSHVISLDFGTWSKDLHWGVSNILSILTKITMVGLEDWGSWAVIWSLGNILGCLPGIRWWSALSTWDIWFARLLQELKSGECGYLALCGMVESHCQAPILITPDRSWVCRFWYCQLVSLWM